MCCVSLMRYEVKRLIQSGRASCRWAMAGVIGRRSNNYTITSRFPGCPVRQVRYFRRRRRFVCAAGDCNATGQLQLSPLRRTLPLIIPLLAIHFARRLRFDSVRQISFSSMPRRAKAAQPTHSPERPIESIPGVVSIRFQGAVGSENHCDWLTWPSYL